jgi:hypothetical protein
VRLLISSLVFLPLNGTRSPRLVKLPVLEQRIGKGSVYAATFSIEQQHLVQMMNRFLKAAQPETH